MKKYNTALNLGLALQPKRLRQVLTALIVAILVALAIALSKPGGLAAALLGLALLALLLAFRFNQQGHMERAASVMLLTMVLVGAPTSRIRCPWSRRRLPADPVPDISFLNICSTRRFLCK